MIYIFNNSSVWAISFMLNSKSRKVRSFRANLLCKVMKYCFKFNNFYATNWILSAIDCLIILFFFKKKNKIFLFFFFFFFEKDLSRLQEEKKFVLKKSSLEILKTVRQLKENNHKEYRSLLAKCKETGKNKK